MIMDSTTRLDFALFQLTPTRTRCDLVIFAGKASEKLASGLLQPFLSHLNSAKDQISKGGYSVKLQPPSSSPWFTKATLERFVQFVGTPEVLERFVTLEQEIAQIETFVKSSGTTDAERHMFGSNGDKRDSASFSKSNGDSKRTNSSMLDETSKDHLQRVLESRKSILEKEQAMAYARALVSGFEMDCIDKLIPFADIFGASRLRVACLNFKKLCNKKNGGGFWRNEVAVMQAFSQSQLSYIGESGLVLAEANKYVQNGILSTRKPDESIDASASGSTISRLTLDKSQDTSNRMPPTEAIFPMTWTNQLHQNTHNQGPAFQHLPPYSGYLFPGIQSCGYYGGHMSWTPNIGDIDSCLDGEPDKDRNHKYSSTTRVRHGKTPQSLQQEGNSNTSASISGSDSEKYEEHGNMYSTNKGHKKEQGKKSLRKVIIRNVNYISSKKDGLRGSSSSSFDDSEYINVDSLRQQVEEGVGSLERRHKSSRGLKRREGYKNDSNVFVSDSVSAQDCKNVAVKGSEGEESNVQWDTFQNLIMKDADSGTSVIDPQSVQVEYLATKRFEETLPVASGMDSRKLLRYSDNSNGSCILNKKYTDEDRSHVKYLETGEVFPVIRRESTDEELLVLNRSGETENCSRGAFSDCSTEASTVKSKQGEWFASDQLHKSSARDENKYQNIFSGGYAASFVGGHTRSEENRNDVYADDSFMIQTMDDLAGNHIKKDMFVLSDLAGATKLKDSTSDNLQAKASIVHEPDDLHMVLGRDTPSEYAVTPCNPEMDYGNNNPLSEAVKNHTNDKPAKSLDAKLASHSTKTTRTSVARERKFPNKEAKPKASTRALGKSVYEIISRSRKPPGSKIPVQNSKLKQEEEKRRKMEEVLLQRQKSIAERTANRGVTSVSTKGILKERKAVIESVKNEKLKVQAPLSDTKKSHKPIVRTSTINRLATSRITHKVLPEAKPNERQRRAIKGNTGEISSSDKTTRVGNKTLSNGGKQIKKDQNTSNSLPSSSSKTPGKKDRVTSLAKDFSDSHGPQPSSSGTAFDNIEKLYTWSSVKKNTSMIPASNSFNENISTGISSNGKLSVQNESDSKVTSKAHQVPQEEKKLSGDPSRVLGPSTGPPLSEGNVPGSPDISVIETSTPPQENHMIAVPRQSRKKWDNTEKSSRNTDGFRKLLLFGLTS